MQFYVSYGDELTRQHVWYAFSDYEVVKSVARRLEIYFDSFFNKTVEVTATTKTGNRDLSSFSTIKHIKPKNKLLR